MKQSSKQACVNSTGISSRLDCSIENERHNSIQFDVATPEFTPLKMNTTDREITNVPVDYSSCETSLDVNSPEFRPSLELDPTDREIVDNDSDDSSNCPDHVGSADCDYGCTFATGPFFGKHDLYVCVKCTGNSSFTTTVCQSCLDAGGHKEHRKYIVYLKLERKT